MKYVIIRGIGIAASVFALNVSPQESERDDPELQYVQPFQVFDNLYYIGADWVASWLLVTDQGLIVFDALYDELTEMAISNIRSLGFDPYLCFRTFLINLINANTFVLPFNKTDPLVQVLSEVFQACD